MFTDSDERVYVVVSNQEEQYSIWPVDEELPLGWRSRDVTGTKQVCLDHIERVWTDITPLSVRQRLLTIPDASP